MIVGRIVIVDDEIHTLKRLRALCEFLADSADEFARHRDVLDEILQRIGECEPDMGGAQARAFARVHGIDVTVTDNPHGFELVIGEPGMEIVYQPRRLRSVS